MDSTILEGARKARFSAATFLIWDHIITFDEELEIWRSRWTWAKALFIANRYLGIVRTLADMALFFNDKKSDLWYFGHTISCDFGFRWQYIMGAFSILSVEIILQLRLYAMYNRNKGLLLFTSILCLAEIVTVMGIIGRNLVDMDVTATGKVACCTLPHPRFFGGFWGPILSFETLLFGLALYKGYTNGMGQAVRSGSPGSNIINSLVRHSALYFFVIFTVYLINLIVPFVIPLKVEYFVEFAMAFSCIMGNRIMLGVRKAFLERTGCVTTDFLAYDAGSPALSRSSGRVSPLAFAEKSADSGSEDDLVGPPPGLRRAAEDCECAALDGVRPKSPEVFVHKQIVYSY